MDESLDEFERRVDAAESSKNAAEISSVLAAYERGVLYRDPPPTSLTTGRLLLAEQTRQILSARLNNTSCDVRRMAEITGTREGKAVLRSLWANLRDIAGWLEIPLDGPEPEL